MYYQYIAYTPDNKITKGTQAAANADVAARILTSHGYRVLVMKPLPAFLPRWEQFLPPLYKTSPQTVITFSRQLALLHESGMDIVASLELLRMQSASRRFREVLREIIAELRQGHKLSKAMSKHPSYFPVIYVQSINVAEQTGNLETVLRQIADYMDREAKAARSVRNALRYPAAVFAVAVVVIVILTAFVLPTFASLYTTLGAELPGLTRFTLSLVGWFSKYGLAILGGLVVIMLGLWMWFRTPEGKQERDKLVLRLPLLGKVVHLSELIRCCRCISILYKAGLPIPEIMVLAVETSNNVVIKKALVQVHQDVLRGEGLSRPMAKSGLFLPMMIQMVSVGEATGNLDNTLSATADTFETEAEDRMRSIIGLIQPAITLILGAVVTFIAVSLISAMYSFYGQVM